MSKLVLDVPTLWADHHVLKVRDALVTLEGVDEVYASAAWKQVLVDFDAGKTDQAAIETWGQVLEYDRKVADTLYSSNCGGHTVNNEDYWPEQSPSPYLRGGPDYDRKDVELDFPLSGDRLYDYLKYAPRVNCNQPQYARTSKIRWWSVIPRSELEESLTVNLGGYCVVWKRLPDYSSRDP